ncbi:transglutaminaseTgpA domain-containing protein [Agromyces archimandritae]|uniref:Transglutaminase domain-containing protein n=1 Tax=Agromyces archimandritae TaxID=2781962 RepID=A0A975FNV2_9MICO|nr:DUF3488 and transglutaminase-like domain-containing protein [Agromyces archimandritae]QTX04456.1 transglutaminase domain-containing protein [Agromyces archimandritae]
MRAETRRNIGQDAALSVASLVLVLIAITGLSPLVQGRGWWWIAAVVAVVAIGSGLGFRALRVPAGVVPLLEILVVIAMLTLFFGEGSGILGLIPSLDTFTVFGELADSAGRAIMQQSPPAVAVPGLLYLLGLGAGIVAVVTDIFVSTLRMPALAAIPVAVPPLVTVFVIGNGAAFVPLLATAAAYLLVLRVDVRVRRAGAVAGEAGEDAPRILGPKRAPTVSTIGATLGIAGIGLLTAGVLAASVPSLPTGFFSAAGQGPSAFGVGVNAFVDLGRDLRRPSPRPVLHYTAEDDSPVYLTLLTLDRIDGQVWLPSERELDQENDVGDIEAPPGLRDEVPRSPERVQVWIDGLDSGWLPQPYPASSVAGLDGSWYWDAETRNIRSADSSTAGQRYAVDRLKLEPDPAMLRAASRQVPAELDRYLELPGEVPRIITETAHQVTADAASPYDAAIELQRFFRGPGFAYSTEAPVRAGYDGGSLDVVATFLEERKGYCVHFASAMALMARELGIPARVALGYTQGTAADTTIDGLERRDVDTHDLHTWPELYFEGVGWLPFEPTPDRGVVPQYSIANTVTETEPSAAPNDPASPAPTPGADGGDRGLTPEQLEADGSSATGADDGAALAALRIWAIALAVLALGAMPALFRMARRRSRLRRIAAGGADAARDAWLEVQDTAVDLGESWAPTLTAREFASELGGRPAFGDAAASRTGRALGAILAAIERDRYAEAAGASGIRPADVSLVLRALRADASPWQRIVATVLPGSLLTGVRPGFAFSRNA